MHKYPRQTHDENSKAIKGTQLTNSFASYVEMRSFSVSFWGEPTSVLSKRDGLKSLSLKIALSFRLAARLFFRYWFKFISCTSKIRSWIDFSSIFSISFITATFFRLFFGFFRFSRSSKKFHFCPINENLEFVFVLDIIYFGANCANQVLK